jgi:hypothetical protein
MNDIPELNRAAQAKATPMSPDAGALLQSYAISAALFSGAPDALYERHLKFDNIVEPETANTRERYKAAARAVRDNRTVGSAPTRPTPVRTRSGCTTFRSNFSSAARSATM